MTEQHYYYGTGRRKTAVARVRVYPGQGGITINGKPEEEILTTPQLRYVVESPLRIARANGTVQVVAKCSGGGISGWAGAVAHGLARALVEMDPQLRPALKAAGALTRDPRMKESKKYGLKRARKAPQYTKR